MFQWEYEVNIWIFNEYAGTPYHGMTFRHYYIAKELVKLGHKVTIFTSSFSHYKLTQHIQTKQSFTRQNIDGIDFVWVKMPPYKAPKSFGRIRNWFLFALKLFFLPVLKLEKPDAILVSSLPLHPILPAKYLANKYQAKLIFEVRDIWPLSAMELGGYSPRNPFIKHLQWLEDFAYKNSDAVVSVLANAYEHMQTRGLSKEKFHYIPNGVAVDSLRNTQDLDAKTLSEIPKGKFIIGYAGTFGVANALDSFIRAAQILQENDALAFVLVGGGKEKEKLLALAKDCKNISFVDSVQKDQVQSLLHCFDVCYIGWKNESIYNYGISANKLFDYMYCAKPILHSFNGKKDIVELSMSGVSVLAENPQEIANGVLKLYSMTQEERDQMGQNALKYVVENHDYKNLAKRLLKVL